MEKGECETPRQEKLRPETVEVLRGLVESVCRAAESYLAGGGRMPTRRQYHFVPVTGSTDIGVLTEEVANLRALVVRYAWYVSGASEQLGARGSTLGEDPLLGPYLSGWLGDVVDEHAKFNARELIVGLALQVLGRAAQQRDEAAFKGGIEKLEEFLRRRTIRFTFCAPLLWVRISRGVQLAPGAELRPLTEGELEEIWGTGEDLIPFEYCHRQVPRVAFVWGHETEDALKRPDVWAVSWKDLIWRLEDALRLSGPLMFCLPLVFVNVETWIASRDFYFWSRLPGPYFGVPSAGSQVPPTVEELWRSLERSNPRGDPRLALVLDRLATASTKTDLTDRLLDCAIGLEALYQGGGIALRLRAAHALGEKWVERREIYDKAGRVWDLRNWIVHGGHIKMSERQDIERGAADAADLLRRSLSYLIGRCRNGKCDWPDWDTLVLGG